MRQKVHMALLYGLIAGMELCWLGVAFDLANRKVAGGSLSLLAALGFFPLAFALRRLLPSMRRSRVLCSSCTAWAASMLVVAKIQLFGDLAWWNPLWLLQLWEVMGRMFHSFNPEGLMVLTSAVLWGFGWRLSNIRVHFSTFVSEFQFGLTILLVAFFAQAQLGFKMPGLIPAALGFFSLALLGMSVSHARERDSWLSGPYRGMWFGLLLLSIGFILALGFLISAAINPSLLNFILALLAKAGQFLLTWIGKFFALLASLFPAPKPAGLPPSLGMPHAKGPPEAPFVLFSESTREVLRFLWTVGCLSLILVALWRVFGDIFDWLRRKLSDMEGAEVEPLPGAFRADLLNLLRRILLALRIKWPFRGGKRPTPLPVETETVRRIYRQLLKWAAARGCARNISQTPLEYLQTLLQWRPQGRWDFTFITHQYIRARYSLLSPTRQDLEQLERSWRQLRQVRSRNAAGKIAEKRS